MGLAAFNRARRVAAEKAMPAEEVKKEDKAQKKKRKVGRMIKQKLKPAEPKADEIGGDV